MRVAYIMSRFPQLSETFILREMIELERQGVSIGLYPLICQKQGRMHPQAEPWVSRAHCRPFFSLRVLADNLAVMIRRPLRYLSSWARVFAENAIHPPFLLRALMIFPQAVSFSRDMVREKTDHIHAHYATHPALAAWVIHRLTGISFSITAHAHDIYVRKTMLRTKLKAARFVAAISEYNRRLLSDHGGPSVAEKISVVHCGIDGDRYRPLPSTLEERRSRDVVCIGSLQPYKGQDYLVRACRLLRDRAVPFRCRIIGKGEDYAALKSLIRELELEEEVELTGPRTQDEIGELLPRANCYVQPSVVTPSGKMEGIPVALMEALASGLPVIATDISGISELVRPGETGWLVPQRDAGALAEAMETVLWNPRLAQQMAAQGRALVLEQFDVQKNGGRLRRLFLGDSEAEG